MMCRFRRELKVLGSAIVCLGAQQFAVSAQERFPNNLLGCHSVIWSDGLTGASLELNLVAGVDSLAGRIRVLTDVVGGDRSPEALALARRSMCQ